MTTHRYRIVHATRLRYDQPAMANLNELRMTPPSEPGQLTLESRLRVRPMNWNSAYVDYWGTNVTAIESHSPHDELSIESTSTVERSDAPESASEALTWDDLRADRIQDELYEYLTPTQRTRLDDEVAGAIVTELVGLSPVDTVERVCGLVNQRVSYQTGVTTVHADAQEVWDVGSGVCQDITHVTLALLRACGVPCRYVSGYLSPKVLEVGQSASGESHAWTEWWDGQWRPVDATNLRQVGLDHVVVARGRDYDDVPPMRGVYQGFGNSTLEVQVTFTRLS